MHRRLSIPSKRDNMLSRRTKSVGVSKVKTGCRTCKIRKVKCDEGRPACYRCVGTGRVCDGYGIWGGGGNSYSSRQHVASSRTSSLGNPQPPPSPFTTTLDTKERSSLEWFRYRTVTKLPGSYISDFWTTLLLQAALSEPAVLHAILSLSSTHESGVRHTEDQTKNDSLLYHKEWFPLEHYVKASNHLRSNFGTEDRKDIRITLIVCIVFISFELFRGHIQTAQVHLHNGLNILQERYMVQNEKNGMFELVHDCNSTEEWILEAFTRLHLQVALFKRPYHPSSLGIGIIRTCTTALRFRSIKEAWQHLQQHLIDTLHLVDYARKYFVENTSSHQETLQLFETQKRVKGALTRWLAAYETFKRTPQMCRSSGEGKAYHLLSAYYTMTKIMLDTSLDAYNELAFDLHTNQFNLLLEQLSHLREVASESSPLLVLPGPLLDLSRSVMDFGWFPPLYYVACKCRVYDLRLQAIELLESCSHREGFWDAKTTVCIVKKVVEIEQGSFYQACPTSDHSSLSCYTSQEVLASPVLPVSHRIRDIEVILSDAVADGILLTFKKGPGVPTEWKTHRAEYVGRLERWIER